MITPPGLPPGCPPWFARPAARAWTCAPAPTARTRAFHARLPGYAPTPLTEVPTVAAELGYADQAHLTRECARLAGLTPAALLAARRPRVGPGAERGRAPSGGGREARGWDRQSAGVG